MADHGPRGPVDSFQQDALSRSDDDLARPSFLQQLSEDSFWRVVVHLVRLIYTHNPFYLISACLALVGLNVGFQTSSATADPWVLLGVLAGYTALMAVTAFVIVRFGKVWQDARSLLPVIVLLLIAMSVSFDEIINEEAVNDSGNVGTALVCIGFVFSVLVSEGLLHGLKIRLAGWFRASYYAVLGLLFGYPLVLRWLLLQVDQETVLMGLLAFPLVAAGAFLILLPAIRRGRAYAANNGTPWAWPWFPGMLFALLGLAACVRSYYLTLSFHGIEGMESIFGSYFLTPFAFAAAVILLETGVAEKKRWLQGVAAALPLAAFAMAFPGQAPAGHHYNEFVKVVLAGFGSPALIAGAAAALFYLYACVRRAPGAAAGLVIVLLASTVVGPKTIGLGSLAGPSALPLALAGLVEVSLALCTKRSYHALLALVLLTGGCATQLPAGWQQSAAGLIPVGVIYLGALAIGLLFRDRFARFLQRVVCLLHTPMLLWALVEWSELAGVTGAAGPWAATAAAVVVPLVYGWLVKSELGFYVGAANAAAVGIFGMYESYAFLKATYGRDAVGPFFWSGASFLVALLISLIKIERVVRGVAGRVIALYRPSRQVEWRAGPV